MKKVILEKREGEVYLSDLNENSIIGILWTDSVRIGFLKNNENDTVSIIRNDKNTVCSCDEDVNSYIKKFRNIDVHVFETTKELFKWMSE